VDPKQGFSPKLKSRVDEQGRFVTPELDDMHPFLATNELEAVRSSASQLHAEQGPTTERQGTP
jgi:acetolactate synthase-1/2/3 large subunit